jgi:hypothetical protein
MVSDGSELTVNSPADLPEATKRDSISEPYVRWVCRGGVGVRSGCGGLPQTAKVDALHPGPR